MAYAAPHGVVLKDAQGFFRLLGCKKVLRGNESQDPRAASCEQSVPCSTRWLSPTAGCSCSITHQGAQPLPAHEFVLCCWIWGTRHRSILPSAHNGLLMHSQPRRRARKCWYHPKKMPRMFEPGLLAGTAGAAALGPALQGRRARLSDSCPKRAGEIGI